MDEQTEQEQRDAATDDAAQNSAGPSDQAAGATGTDAPAEEAMPTE